MRKDVGRRHPLHSRHPPAYIGGTGELKTKPTNTACASCALHRHQPDVIVCRGTTTVPDGLREKVALFCGVDAGP